MKLRKQQSGMGILSMLIIGIMVGFFAMCAIRMTPIYLEYLTVKDLVSGVAAEFDPDVDNIATIRRKLANLLNTNQVYQLESREIEVFRKEGKTWIDANYEARIPIAGRIDAVMNFDDLLFEAGKKPGE